MKRVVVDGRMIYEQVMVLQAGFFGWVGNGEPRNSRPCSPEWARDSSPACSERASARSWNYQCRASRRQRCWDSPSDRRSPRQASSAPRSATRQTPDRRGRWRRQHQPQHRLPYFGSASTWPRAVRQCWPGRGLRWSASGWYKWSTVHRHPQW